VELLAPAKINLFLRVVGRRPDGYHELCSLMCGVGLYDRLVLELGGDCNTVRCSHPDVPNDATNLALKAANCFNQALARDTDRTPVSVAIQLDKTIPVGAGLGGGSSDAAAVLKGLNAFHGHPFDDGRMHALALSLGADVPFFIHGRPSLVTGIGERLSPYTGLPAMDVVLVYPGFGLSTARVFKNLNLALTKSKKKLRYFPFNNGSFSPTHHLHNDLESGVGDRFPAIADVKQALIQQGAIGALMTGSGSAVFGLFADTAGASRAKAVLGQQREWQVFATRLLA
jgi:4-diphosphocytidyl-2-C-methyl-D-erythritol kinase